MFEIIFLIIIIFIFKKVKSSARPPAHHTPPIISQSPQRKPALSEKEVTRQVNKQIYGTENPQDRATVYNRLILTDRYQNIEKIAHELGISKQQALQEIKKLKEQGHYLQVEIDERNYRLIYSSSLKTSFTTPKKPSKSVYAKKTPAPPKREEERTFVEPAKPYRPSVNSGEHYEEWMPVPAGKKVVHCGYCGADNLISEKQDPHQCTCYFCREEL